jgi:hydrogenase-4 component B
LARGQTGNQRNFMSADELMLVPVFVLCGAGALLGILISDRGNSGLLAWFGSLAALLTIWVSGGVLLSGHVFQGKLWTIRGLGSLLISLDRLSALFLFVAGVVVLASSIFSASYLKRYSGRYSLRALNALYLLLFASVVLILIANDLLTFLLAWELMSILSYLLVTFEHQRAETSRAAFLMLAMGEVGFMLVALALLFLATKARSLEFSALKSTGIGLGAAGRWILFLVTFFGFGIKAGLVPFNTWLPRAHPAAPANVSAILSGVILNLGLYGIIRVNLDLVPVKMIGAGVVMLVVGTISALVGILYATIENDLKAMLAHSSIENIGIVTAGLGAGLIFATYGKPGLAGIAFIAAFYHMINHSVYKALLFLGAGTLDERIGTRDLNSLGGLIRRMPWTGACFLVGTLSIAALPPFNGFVSEWLTLQTMLRSAELSSIVVKIVFALCGAALALTAALAVTCFVKAFAMGFLGMNRTPQTRKPLEAPRSMTASMVLLAALCLLLGVLPTFIIPILNHVLQPIAGANAAAALVPPFFASNPAHAKLPIAFAAEFHDLGAQVGQAILPGEGLVVMHRGGQENPVVFAMSTSYMLPVLLALLALIYVFVRFGLTGRRRVTRRLCWDGGVRRLFPQMTYTATGFSNPVRVIFEEVLRPIAMVDIRETVSEHFRIAIRRRREEVHIVERYVAAPLRDGALNVARYLAAMHHGRINDYAGYGLLALIIALILALILSTPT